MHNSTIFCDSNENILDSLVWDTQVLINRWQNAADNGYGLGQWWGTAANALLLGFDWFCAGPLRNLVAIAAYVTMVAVYGGAKVYAWYQRNQEEVALAADVALTVAEVAAEGVAGGLSLDGWCPCWGNPWVADAGAEQVIETPGLTDWAFARYGRVYGPVPSAAALVLWAKGLG